MTKDEWVKMWTNTLATIQSGQPFPAWQQQYMEFMFYANDTSGWYTLAHTLTNTLTITSKTPIVRTTYV